MDTLNVKWRTALGSAEYKRSVCREPPCSVSFLRRKVHNDQWQVLGRAGRQDRLALSLPCDCWGPYFTENLAVPLVCPLVAPGGLLWVNSPRSLGRWVIILSLSSATQSTFLPLPGCFQFWPSLSPVHLSVVLNFSSLSFLLLLFRILMLVLSFTQKSCL